MRVDIVVAGAQPTAGAWTVVLRRDGADVATHAMAATASGYPLPPTGGLDEAKLAAVLASLCDDTATVADVHALGDHMFAALIGPVWATLAPALATTPLVELALSLEAGILRGLPWELMRADNAFLAAGVTIGAQMVDVAITRRVARNTKTKFPELLQPLRYMFVVGTELGDAVRAGAEALGLLRQIAPAVRDHFVQRQSPASLGTEVAAFDPHVVHMICHGRPGPNGIELEMWDDDAKQPAFVGATELVDKLVRVQPDGSRVAPALVILSACSTGQRIDVSETNDIATALVAAGVPIVVGMSAEIRDLACRLFTRRMGLCAIDRVPLLAAAVAGRRLALRHPDLPAESFDWGMIQMLFGADVDSSVAVRKCEPNSDEDLVLKWLGLAALPIDLDPARRTVSPLCAATDVISTFWRLMSNPTYAAMLIQAFPAIKKKKPTEPGRLLRVGKRRAFAEVVAAAIRAGHVPVVVLPRRTRYPSSPADLVRELRSAFVKARSQRDLAVVGQPLAGLSDDPSEDELLTALEKEALALAADARAKHDFIARSNGEVVVMLHDVHMYSAGAALALALLGATGAGFGKRIRSVISWAKMIEGDPAWRAPLDEELDERLRTGPGWIAKVELRPLGDIDASLAYQRLLLHPYRPEPDYAARQWFLDLKEATSHDTTEALRLMKKATDGYIGAIDDSDFVDWLEEITLNNHVRPASDDEILGTKR